MKTQIATRKNKKIKTSSKPGSFSSRVILADPF